MAVPVTPPSNLSLARMTNYPTFNIISVPLYSFDRYTHWPHTILFSAISFIFCPSHRYFWQAHRFLKGQMFEMLTLFHFRFPLSVSLSCTLFSIHHIKTEVSFFVYRSLAEFQIYLQNIWFFFIFIFHIEEITYFLYNVTLITFLSFINIIFSFVKNTLCNTRGLFYMIVSFILQDFTFFFLYTAEHFFVFAYVFLFRVVSYVFRSALHNIRVVIQSSCNSHNILNNDTGYYFICYY